MMRLGIHRSTAWRVSRVNDSYELCPTYPKVLAVPTQISDKELFGVKNFRKRGRIPVCVWRLGCVEKVYEKGSEAVFAKEVEGQDVGDVCIMRSAQPRINSHHTNLDVKMISMLAQTSLERDEEGKPICIIFDARPFLSSVGNFARGGGFENSLIYREMRLVNLDIQNIHCVREAWVQINGLFSLCQSKNMDYVLTQSTVESQVRNNSNSTSWLSYVSQILCGAKKYCIHHP